MEGLNISDFINLINLYQQNGDRKIIEMILSCTDRDFYKNPSRKVIDKGSIKIGERLPNSLREVKILRKFKPSKRKVKIELSSPEEYIAYRIKAFTTLVGKFGKRRTNKPDDDDVDYSYDYLIDYAYYDDYDYDMLSYGELENCIYDLDINRFTKTTFKKVESIFMHDVRHIRELNDLVGMDYFKDLWDNLNCVKEVMGYSYEPFIDLLKYYTEQSKNKDEQKDLKSVGHQQKEEELKNDEKVIKALEIALSKVDTKRTDKEIVRYVNKVWESQYINLREKSFKDIDIDIDVWIFGKTTKVLGNSMNDLFQKRQLEFIKEVQNILKNYDVKRRLGNGSKLNVPNKREIAKIMGMSESNFKHKLSRIKNKVLDNWEQLIEKSRKYK